MASLWGRCERRYFLLLSAIAFATLGCCQAAIASTLNPIDCRQATLARPGNGRSFTGIISNDDYGFSVEIPKAYTGWDGAASDAPFHGFAIFLDPQMKSCILFEIRLRADYVDMSKVRWTRTLVHLGAAPGWQSTKNGLVAGTYTTNINTMFSSRQRGETSDGEILLIAPTSRLSEVRGLYDAFIGSLKFEP